MDNRMLSVIIPSYNEEGMISKTVKLIHTLLEDEAIPHELIFVSYVKSQNGY